MVVSDSWGIVVGRRCWRHDDVVTTVVRACRQRDRVLGTTHALLQRLL